MPETVASVEPPPAGLRANMKMERAEEEDAVTVRVPVAPVDGLGSSNRTIFTPLGPFARFVMPAGVPVTSVEVLYPSAITNNASTVAVVTLGVTADVVLNPVTIELTIESRTDELSTPENADKRFVPCVGMVVPGMEYVDGSDAAVETTLYPTRFEMVASW